MLYLTLNQAFMNVINNDVPNEIMKIIYQYVISLNNKIKINNLFNIFTYDHNYEKDIKLKNVNTLKQQYSDISNRWLLKNINNSGKNNSMKKEDYIKKICYNNYWNNWTKKFDDLNNDKIFAYNIDTKKYITEDDYKKIREEYENEFKTDYINHMLEFQLRFPKYIDIIINSEDYLNQAKIQSYSYKQMKDKYKECKAKRRYLLAQHTRGETCEEYCYTSALKFH
jgi:hypothetical protein